ncbi:MAG: metallophosphoesterase [Clostridiales bacterium]|nr:metallophosphoesterase [Clostridiales bacterium]
MIKKKLITCFLSVPLAVRSFSARPVRRNEEIKLKAVLVADLHTDGDRYRDRNNVLRRVFGAIGRTQNDADTLVLAGDITNCGDEKEYRHLDRFIDFYAKIKDCVPEMGNHDSWHHSDDPDYETAEKNFKDFCKNRGVKTDKIYFSKKVNGFTFISVGAEGNDFDDPYFSDEQYAWLDGELKGACAEGKPVFVICHRPIEHMFDCAERFLNIMRSNAEGAAAPVIYVSGHLHVIGENTFSNPFKNLYYLNLPSALYNDGGGMGFNAEVYDGKIIFTGMNYIKNRKLDGFTYTVGS